MYSSSLWMRIAVTLIKLSHTALSNIYTPISARLSNDYCLSLVKAQQVQCFIFSVSQSHSVFLYLFSSTYFFLVQVFVYIFTCTCVNVCFYSCLDASFCRSATSLSFFMKCRNSQLNSIEYPVIVIVHVQRNSECSTPAVLE